ncbi:hypothetical protein K490DRAFT_65267 [Saccharata proteae CBS 121410]|uniref:Alpha/gamma-adaptin-binding protein p34 n=1 Tax=Saccharata proteae CBS 121410 TaxID=1314787 RepID=A0A9P4HX26_9PEZI|nr:hypothetical protein K490DRAFT_65267 [Saccharata proteae CBS 121410]
MEITNPRRILAVGAPDSGILSLLNDLTGSAPTPNDDSTAGLSHTWSLKTSYYTAELPIWIDEIPDVEQWRAEFVKPEAKEVVNVLGAWIYCFRKPVTESQLGTVKATMRAIAQVVERAWGFSWEGVCLAVAMPQGMTPHLQKTFDEWEDMCREYGFEYIDSEATGRNDFGEPVGIARIKESLETNEWAGEDGGGIDGLDEWDEDDVENFHETFAAEEAEMGIEMMGLKTAINGGDDAKDALGQDEEADEAAQVEELERTMSKMHAIKDMGESMPEEQRKRFAAKAVNDLMKTL